MPRGVFPYTTLTPGLTHMLLEASSLCWVSSTWSQHPGSEHVSEGPTLCPLIALPSVCHTEGAPEPLARLDRVQVVSAAFSPWSADSLFPMPTGSPPAQAGQCPGLSLTPRRLNEGCAQLFPTPAPNVKSSCLSREPTWDMNSL